MKISFENMEKLYYEKKYKDCFLMCRVLLERNLGDFTLSIYYASCLVMNDRIYEGIDWYNRLLELRETPGIYRLRGYAYYELGDLRKAHADYKKAKNMDPKNPVFWDCLAMTSYGLIRRAEAYNFLEKSIKLSKRKERGPFITKIAFYIHEKRIDEAFELLLYIRKKFINFVL
jgi:tetratricopeptide (TPR) repeat protein